MKSANGTFFFIYVSDLPIICISLGFFSSSIQSPLSLAVSLSLRDALSRQGPRVPNLITVITSDPQLHRGSEGNKRGKNSRAYSSGMQFSLSILPEKKTGFVWRKKRKVNFTPWLCMNSPDSLRLFFSSLVFRAGDAGWRLWCGENVSTGAF